MGKLFKLKKWLTISEAANHLSIIFGEQVSDADVLRLGLDGQLTLSVDFVNHATVKTGKWIPRNQSKNLMELERAMGKSNEHLDYPIWVSDEKIFSISGIWDLTMIGGERLDVENRYQHLVGGVEVTLINIDGAFVKGAENLICQLQECFDDNEHSGSDNYYPAGGLPDDSVLVVRTSALSEFESQINTDENATEKPLSTTERTSLLTILAALCDYSKIKYRERGAAAQIARLTEASGAPVSEDTISKALKKIPNAIKDRMK